MDESALDLPFSHEDWERVKELARSCGHAILADDDVLADSLYLQLADLIAELRARYDDHPVLIETLADFTHDTRECHALYAEAADRAGAVGYPAYTIRLSWAQSLVDEGEFAAAKVQLETCAEEVASFGDEDEQRDHRELLRQCAGA